MVIDTIALSGKATDTKAGAVVLLADGRLVYIEGLDFWPADLIGKYVSVTGLLKRKNRP